MGNVWHDLGSRIFGETSVKIIPGSLNALGHAMLRNTAAINPLTLAQTLQLMDKNFVGTRMALLEEDHHCFPHPGAMLQHHVVPGWLFL